MIPIWKPDEDNKCQTNMWRFMGYVNAQYGLSLKDYHTLQQWSVNNIASFWQSIWEFFEIKHSASYTDVLKSSGHMIDAQWFTDARFNFAENLLQYCTPDNADNTAIVFHGEDKVKRQLSFAELYRQVAAVAQTLKSLGIKSGDRVVGFMPNMPEAVVAMLATTSIGAIWSSCSPDFGFQGVMDRFGQIKPKVLFTADGYYFKGETIDSLGIVQSLVKSIESIELIIVVPYVNDNPVINSLENSVLYSDLISRRSNSVIEFEQLPFNHPLYIMYSSGTTGVPKCIVHGAGGTLLQHLKELSLHSDLQTGDKLFYYTTCGWMMWNWMVSGLAVGATLVLYDGSPFYPDENAMLDLIDDEQINIFGSSAKYISALEKSGVIPRNSHNLGSLKVILSTGSPLAPESFDYVYRDIKSDLQLSSISGGTDIISCFALGSPILPVYKGELQCVGLGMDVVIYDEAGNETINERGELVCKSVFPSMPLYFWNDDNKRKYLAAYFARFDNVWAHGDYGQLTENKGLIIYGRSDAVLNPGGVRIGTAEIYRQVEKLPEILESIAIAQEWKDDVRIILFVKLRDDVVLNNMLENKIRHVIRSNTTPRHVPAKIIAVKDIPRTISGKIIELAVRNVVHHRPVLNTDAMANPEALDYFRNLTELESE